MKGWTLARLKAVCAFLGAVLTTATLLDWGVVLPQWVTAAAALLTAIAVYVVPNVGYDHKPRRALDE